MSISAVTSRHKVRHTRKTMTPGPSGGRTAQPVDLGVKICTINPDSEFQSQDFAAYNQQRAASIYFHYDPETRALDEFQLVEKRIGAAWIPVTNGPIYRVESQLDFQRHSRLWRVRAMERDSLATR